MDDDGWLTVDGWMVDNRRTYDDGRQTMVGWSTVGWTTVDNQTVDSQTVNGHTMTDS